MKTLAILQARMGSSRLPGKVLKEINGRPMIEWQILRILKSRVNKLVLATSNDKSDDELAKTVSDMGIEVFRGSLNDVHSRFVKILQKENPRYFIRLTGDCPVVMPNIIDEMLSVFESQNYDYLSNTNPPTFPDGLDIEIVSTQSFLESSKLHLTEDEREHVTLGIHTRPSEFRIGNFISDVDLSRMRWTVDYEEDLEFIMNVFEFFKGNETYFTMDDILKALKSGQVSENSISHDFRNISLKRGI